MARELAFRQGKCTRMAQRILVALDGSEEAWRAVDYVATMFGQVPGVQVMLLHVQPGLPAELQEYGHVLSESGAAALQALPVAVPGLVRTLLIEGAGHFIQQERPQIVNEALI